MNVIVDTSVWSLALRRNQNKSVRETEELVQLIEQGRVVIFGPIRQEILSGIKDERQFKKLKTHLSNFPDYISSQNDFETAAKYFNTCRRRGVQGSNTDFLICAVSVNNDFSIFTTDKDFILFKKHLPIKLHIY